MKLTRKKPVGSCVSGTVGGGRVKMERAAHSQLLLHIPAKKPKNKTGRRHVEDDTWRTTQCLRQSFENTKEQVSKGRYLGSEIINAPIQMCSKAGNEHRLDPPLPEETKMYRFPKESWGVPMPPMHHRFSSTECQQLNPSYTQPVSGFPELTKTKTKTEGSADWAKSLPSLQAQCCRLTEEDDG